MQIGKIEQIWSSLGVALIKFWVDYRWKRVYSKIWYMYFLFISEPSHMIRTQMKLNLVPWLSIRNNRSTDGGNEYLWEEKVRLNWISKINLNLKCWGCWLVQNYLSKPHVSFHFPHFPKTNSVIRQMLLFQFVRFRYVNEICFFLLFVFFPPTY